ncbi:MAG: chromate transporter [Clostridiales bacterium]|nr:chromate transporter [Clostridiales bacterium]
MIYLKLFLGFIQVGLFSIGGGYAAIPLIQEQAVTLNSWITLDEFTDLITIAEMTPGPIAVNSATFVGIRIAGIPGALVATFACILPSVIIVSLLAALYEKFKKSSVMQNVLSGLRPAVVALIFTAGLNILILVVFKNSEFSAKNIQWLGLILFAAAFFALRKFKLNPILVMCLCGAANLAVNLLIT